MFQPAMYFLDLLGDGLVLHRHRPHIAVLHVAAQVSITLGQRTASMSREDGMHQTWDLEVRRQRDRSQTFDLPSRNFTTGWHSAVEVRLCFFDVRHRHSSSIFLYEIDVVM